MTSSAIFAMAMVLGLGLSTHQVDFSKTHSIVKIKENKQSNKINQNKQNKMIVKLEKQYPQLSRAALIAGVRAYRHLREQGKDPQQILTLVNFNKPSNEKRLWVLDMRQGRVKYHTFVAHGHNSGLKVAKYFSNKWSTHKSSIGVYLTGSTYYGVDGYSMRLFGLDKGFNDHAYRRYIVMHPAWYVSPAFVKKYGQVGRTYGCFGINKKLAPKIISTIKEGTVMVAYCPNKKWLKHSPYEQPLVA